MTFSTRPTPDAFRFRARPGAALVVAIVVLVVIDCIVAGTVHLAILERRLADNAALALRLRLAAESSARLAAAAWSPGLDSILPGDAPTITSMTRTADGLDTYSTVERLNDGLFLVRATAQQPAPHPGRANAAILVIPPAFRHGIDPAAAALTAATALIGATGTIDTGAPECADRNATAVRLTGGMAPTVHDDASLDGAVEYIGEAESLTRDLPRVEAAIAAATPHDLITFVEGDVMIDEDMDGVLVATGGVTITAATTFRGLLIGGGSLTIDEMAALHGAAHVAAHATIQGLVRLDTCTIHDIVLATLLHRPRPLPERPWIPAF
jgi:hypothetical protein